MEVGDLDVDEELASIRDDFVANGEEQIALLEKAQTAGRGGRQEGLQEDARERRFAQTRRATSSANQLGADDCIELGTSPQLVAWS